MNAPLTAPRVSGFTVNVVIMARASANMRFGVPADSYLINNNLHSLQTLRYQGEEDDSVPREMITLGELSNKEYPSKEVLWGEEIVSARALCQKFTPYQNLQYGYTLLSPWMVALPHYIPPPYENTTAAVTYTWNPQATTNPPFTYIGWYSAFFTGVRGSMRYKIYNTSTSGNLDYIVAPYGAVNSLSSIFSTTATSVDMPWCSNFATQEVGPANCGEFLLPAYQHVKYEQPRFLYNLGADSEQRCNVLGLPQTRSTAVNGYVCVGAGPDFTAVRFRRTPGFLP